MPTSLNVATPPIAHTSAVPTTVAPALGLIDTLVLLLVTVLPDASTMATTGCVVKAAPFAAPAALVTMTNPLAAPAVPVAVNVTGEPASPVAVAVRVFAPTVVPSVQLPTVAVPLAFVVWLLPVREPPPLATAKITLTPLTGVLLASVMITVGRVTKAPPTVVV